MKDANRLKFTPDGKLVLILDGGAALWWCWMRQLERRSNGSKVAPGDSGDGGILVLPDGSRAYLGLKDDHNSVAVVDLKTLEVAGRISMGPKSGPGCIIWTSPRH